MDIYFKLWAMSQHYFIHFIALIVPALAIWNSFSGSCAPLTCLHHCACVHVSPHAPVCVYLYSGTMRYSCRTYNASALESTISPRKLDSFY